MIHMTPGELRAARTCPLVSIILSADLLIPVACVLALTFATRGMMIAPRGVDFRLCVNDGL